jgi:uncharacterized protein
MRFLLRLVALIGSLVVVRILLGLLHIPGLLIAAAVLVTYWFAVKLIERRRADELVGGYRQLGWGAAIGAGLCVLIVGLLAIFGLYHVDGANSFGVIFPVLSISVLAGVFEELLLRGVLFRMLELRLGTWWSLGLSALIFGLLHLLNPGVTVVSALAVAIEAGVMLGAAYAATRKLWLPIALHAAWNFTETGIFGVPVSGLTMDGLLRAHTSGPAILSGGSFGIEGSLLTVIFGLIISWLFLRKATIIPRSFPARRPAAVLEPDTK